MLDDWCFEHKMQMRRLESDEAAQEGECLEPAALGDQNVVDGEEEFLPC